jgi:hypothetical protein
MSNEWRTSPQPLLFEHIPPLLKRVRTVVQHVAIFVLALALLNRAFGSDAGEAACRAELVKNRKIAGDERWETSPLPGDVRNDFGRSLGNDEQIVRWLAHDNPNGAKTLVIETKSVHDDMNNWLILLRSGSGVAATDLVYALDFAFSKASSNGVNGLYFCGKQGVSPEWIWTGADWRVRDASR